MSVNKIIIVFICAFPFYGKAQINLVLNPSFEQYSKCPQSLDVIKYANYWTSITDTLLSATDTISGICSPEFCHTCSSSYDVKVPTSFRYNHYPRSGKGMAQLVMFCIESDTTNFYRRDYLQGRFKSVLITGKSYCITFHVLFEPASAYSINHIGAYLDNGSIDTTSNCGMPQTSYIPQIYETTILGDTSQWIKIAGTFTSNGTEKFITIGNFFDSTHTSVVPHISTIPNLYWSWYLVDDVSVIATDAVADAGHDTVITTAATDSAFIGTNEGYIPCKWYRNGVLIDSNKSGFKVKPTATSSYVMELDVCGNVTRDSVKVQVWPVSVVNYQLSIVNVRVYPNPATNELIITGAKGCEAMFYDIVGKATLHAFCNSDKEVIDISALPKGVYTMQVVDMATGEKIVRKAIKE